MVEMRIPRFLFRVKNREIEAEAKALVEALGIDDVEIRRDDTIAEAWLEDYEAGRTIYGFEEIREYLEKLVKGR